MLGRLCRLLRMCGIDAACAAADVAVIARSRSEGRTVLTRSRRLCDRPGVHCVTSDQPLRQLEGVLDRFDLRSEIDLLSRCLVCNEHLQDVAKDEIRTLVPYYVYREHDHFRRCGRCGRVYWRGTHVAAMMRALDRVIRHR